MSSNLIKISFICLLLILLSALSVKGDAPPSLELADKPVVSENTPVPECNEKNWSAGSAFFTIVALCFGFYGYPRGCLIVPSSGRTWRLSPILVLEELIFGIILFLWASRARINTVIFCFALLAYRSASGFNSTTVEEELGLTVQRPPLEPNTEWLQAYVFVREANGFRPEEGLWSTEEGRPRERQRDPTATINAAFMIVEERRREYNIDLFRRILYKLKNMDRGPSYRIFIWIPMCLQLSKLLVVLVLSPRPAWLVFTSGFIYFFAWLGLESVSYKASKNSLSEDDIEAAARLCHEWAVYFSEYRGEEKFRAKTSFTAAYSIPSLILVTSVNIGLIGKFAYDLVPGPSEVGVVITITSVMLFFFSSAQYPFLLQCVEMIVLWIWKVTGGERRYGRLWQETPDYDVASYYTASAALCEASLAIWAFAGIYSWSNSFHCWEMQKPSFYDWLG